MDMAERIEDAVAWQNRLEQNETQALLNGREVIKTLYLDGNKYLRIRLSILDIRATSQILGGEE